MTHKLQWQNVIIISTIISSQVNLMCKICGLRGVARFAFHSSQRNQTRRRVTNVWKFWHSSGTTLSRYNFIILPKSHDLSHVLCYFTPLQSKPLFDSTPAQLLRFWKCLYPMMISPREYDIHCLIWCCVTLNKDSTTMILGSTPLTRYGYHETELTQSNMWMN